MKLDMGKSKLGWNFVFIKYQLFNIELKYTQWNNELENKIISLVRKKRVEPTCNDGPILLDAGKLRHTWC